MDIVNLEQGSEEWLEFRRTRITATDFAIYAAHLKLCKNMYKKSLKTLLKDKISGKRLKDNKYFALGRQKEDELLNSCNAISMQKGLIATCKNNPRIMSSFDGIDNIIRGVFESKASTKDVFKFAEQLDYYQWQILHQAYTADYIHGHLVIGYYDEVPYNGKYIWQERAKMHADIDVSKLMTRSEWIECCNNFLFELDCEGLWS